jgi:hypothetical protein
MPPAYPYKWQENQASQKEAQTVEQEDAAAGGDDPLHNEGAAPDD